MGLFKPVWMNTDYQKAKKVFNKKLDEQTLVSIAMQAPDDLIRTTATERIEDQGTLLAIAMQTPIAGQCAEAVRKLHDQNSVVTIILGKKSDLVAEIGVRSLDEAHLAEIVCRLPAISINAFRTAMGKITSQVVLVDGLLAYEGSRKKLVNEVRFYDELAPRLTDPASILRYIMASGSVYHASSFISPLLDHIDDDAALLDIFERGSPLFRNAALARVKNQDTLARLALTREDDAAGRTALASISSTAVLASLAQKCRGVAVRGRIFRRLLDGGNADIIRTAMGDDEVAALAQELRDEIEQCLPLREQPDKGFFSIRDGYDYVVELCGLLQAMYEAGFAQLEIEPLHGRTYLRGKLTDGKVDYGNMPGHVFILHRGDQSLVTFTENHPIHGVLPGLQYRFSGSGLVRVTRPGGAPQEWFVTEDAPQTIELFNKDTVAHERTVSKTSIPYTAAEESAYQQYLAAAAEGT